MHSIRRSRVARTLLFAAMVALVAGGGGSSRAHAAGRDDGLSAAETPAGPPRRFLPVSPPASLVSAAEADASLLSPLLTMPIAAAPAPIARRAALPPVTVLPRAAAEAAPRARIAAEPRTADPRRPGITTSQIAHIKHALNLRPEQEQYWQPVEAVLRDIERQQKSLAAVRQDAAAQSAALAIDPDKIQQLTYAAFPLILSLDDAQKREARNLARAMGLESVAAAI